MTKSEKRYYIDTDKRFIDSLLSDKYEPLGNTISEENQFKAFLNSYKFYGKQYNYDADDYTIFNKYLETFFAQEIEQHLEEPGEVHLFAEQDTDIIWAGVDEWLEENQDKVQQLYSDYLGNANIQYKTDKEREDV